MSTMDANEFIKGGYILQPRVIDESDIIHEPPVVRELWLYLLRKVNHRNIGKFKRGSGFFSLEDISNDLHWFVGFRKMKYSKPQLTKSLRRLRERNMIATMKATRGVFVTICKYDYYQDPKNYEGNDEEIMKETRKQRGGITKNKNDKNDKNVKESISAEKFDFLKALISLGVDMGIATDWLKVREKKRAANTETAFKAIDREIKLSGVMPNDCIRIATERSWTGFKAEWLNGSNQLSARSSRGIGGSNGKLAI